MENTQGAYADADSIYGDVLTYTATLANGSALPSWLTFDAASRTFSGVPGNTDVGSLNVVVTATDTSGLSASSTFALNVANVNDAPTVAQPLAAQNITQGQLYQYTIPAGAFADPDSVHGDVLTYSAMLTDGSALPAWLTFDTASRTFSGTAGDPGSLSLRLVATDAAGASVATTFDLDVAYTSTPGQMLVGTSANNTLTGSAGDDTLDGLAGSDTMTGGLGNDTYLVDRAADKVIENAYQGIDTVQSTVTYTLAANVENLELLGTSSLAGYGNALDNIITGNSGSNTLDGGVGADTLVGGMGNDVYVVDNSGDVVTENPGEGTDRVNASIDYTLGSDLENLTLTGTTAITGTGTELNNAITGNALDNVLYGMDGNDTLNGGLGADTLVGGMGNDVYVVDNSGDVVTENPGELVQHCFCKFEFIRPGARAERLAKVSEDRRRVLRGYITSNLEGVKSLQRIPFMVAL
ncbi:MAG: hypothetical protein AUK50_00285 [Comamonadaceae bacterium CG2_30_57_122]|nr:MAG: hypothetical protein AUK50_00285 [Comamonadaceae bacterium CG2_30_57_122]